MTIPHWTAFCNPTHNYEILPEKEEKQTPIKRGKIMDERGKKVKQPKKDSE